MAKGLVNESSLNSIAEAINVLNGTNGEYHPSEMGAAIIRVIPTETASGNPIHITDAAAYPAVSVVTTLEPIQEGSGDPSPENVRPITGHTGVELTRTGKNLLNNELFLGTPIQVWVGHDGTSRLYTFLKAGTYTFSFKRPTNKTFGLYALCGDTQITILTVSSSATTGTLTVEKDGEYTFWFYKSTTAGSIETSDISDVQLELGSTATEYTPYQGEEISVEFPALGENLLDPNSLAERYFNAYGFTITRAGEWITISGTYSGTGRTPSFRITQKKDGSAFDDNYKPFADSASENYVDYIGKTDSNATLTIILKNMVPNTAYTIKVRIFGYSGSTAPTAYEPYTNTAYGCEVDWVNGVLRVTKANIASYNGETLPSTWISDRDVYAEGTTPSIGAQVVYELATSIEIPLTPEVITLLKGENNVWTDSGSTEIEYKVDLQSDIQKPIPETVVKKFFDAQRTGKVYQVKIPKFADNDTTVCIKQLDNAGLVAEPSTDSVIGRDDYLDIPVFQWYRCNYIRDAAGVAIVTALEGDSNYSTTGTADVGSLVMSRYRKWEDFGTYSLLTISDSPHPELGLQLMKNSKDKDDNDKGYMIFSAYYGLYSQPDVAPLLFISHNTALTAYQAKGAGYWGQDDERLQFIYDNIMLKYATKSSQTVFKGCSNYNYQYDAAYKDSTAHTYFPLTSAQAANIEVGSAVCVGYASLNTSTGALNKDRGQMTVKSKIATAKVLKKETITLDGVDYVGVYLDIPAEQAFDTLDTDVSNATYPDTYSPAMLSTMPWWSGSTDAVIGKRDGSLGSNTDDRHPFRIMGVEAQIGAWDVVCDTVMRINADYSTDFFQAPKGVTHSTSESTIASTYTLIGTMDKDVGGSTSFWVGDVTSPNGTLYPSARGNSDSKGCGDYCYRNTNTGWRGVLRGGNLGYGSRAGCACLNCHYGLASAYWGYAVAD